MTNKVIPTFERELMASMLAFGAAADDVRRRERRINRHLRRNLRLERTLTGYCIADRYSGLCEAMNLSLQQAEAWTAERFPSRRQRAC